MGRPVNKRYFGTPTAGGKEIKVRYYNGTTDTTGWIVKQLGSKKFKVTNNAGEEKIAMLTPKSTTFGMFQTLVNGVINDHPTIVEMGIVVELDSTAVGVAGAVHPIEKIAGRKITAAGLSHPWNFVANTLDPDTEDGAVQMEEAGDDAAGTNADDFLAP